MLKYLVVFVALIAGLAIWFKPSAVVTSSDTLATTPINEELDERAVPELKGAASNQLPDFLQGTSLKGTAIDGLYPVDENGNLLLSGSIKHRFEYFLSTMGEFSLEQVQAMIRDDITLNLEEPARSQALQLFEDYVGYKYALSDLEQSLQAPQPYEINDIERMRLQLQQLRDKRREYFNQETVDAFFGFDELYDDFMLNRLDIQSNSQLTAEEKSEQISSLEQSLPAEVRSMRDETQRISQVFELTNQMRDEGASDSEIFERNSQEFGQAAAERLQQLDNQRQAFAQKAEGFIARKQLILANDSLTDTEKQTQIDEALTAFDDNEKRRLKALELMQLEPQTSQEN
tara:strand:+ start:2359 stop:3393 length:1035 start_codon:yes stop_codon:yes gene_type:complete